MTRWVRVVTLAGLAGGLAMAPVGLVLRSSGQPVNVYGELLMMEFLGTLSPIALAVEHALVSIAMALPLVILIAVRRMVRVWLVGMAYGVIAWAVVNATLLPVLFGRPTAWQVGLGMTWASLAVHVVFGIVTAAVASRLLRQDLGRIEVTE